MEKNTGDAKSGKTKKENAALKLAKRQIRVEKTEVNKTLTPRTAELLLRFITRDMQNIYCYPGKPCENFHRICENPTLLPRSSPEAEGVSSAALCRLLNEADGDGQANVLQILLLRHGKVICDAVWQPYRRDIPHQLYSASKSVTATAIGMLMDEGKLDIDERLVDIFPDKAKGGNSHPLAGITVRHLLTMSTGVAFNETGTALGTDWESDFLGCGAKFEPGSEFEYNSMNTYMLSAIVRRRSGMCLTDYLTPRLFRPLGVGLIDWEKCPEGTEKGGWGLSITAEDLAKIGQLYLQNGVWEGKRLLSEQWIEQATGCRIKTTHAESRHGYGYQIWMLPDDEGYLFNGAFGQYVMMLPKRDAVAVIYSGTCRLFADNGIVTGVLKALEDSSDTPLPDDPEQAARLALTLDGLDCDKRDIYGNQAGNEEIEPLAQKLDGCAYSIGNNHCSLFPVILQSVHNIYSPGVRRVAFKALPGGLAIKFFEGDSVNALAVGRGGYYDDIINLKGERHRVAVRCSASKKGDGVRLSLRLHFLQTPFTSLITLDFEEDRLRIDCDEFPSLRAAGTMMLQLANVAPRDTLKNLEPLLQRESVEQLVKTYTTTRAQGRLVRRAK